MELREYLQILRRRWWIPVGLTLLVAAISGVQLQPWQPVPPSYVANLRMLVGVLPMERADPSQYDPRYYAWLTSEYLVDDFTEVVRSQLFTERVARRLADRGLSIPAGTIQGSATSGKQHRIIYLTLTWPDPQELEAMARATAAELEENAAFYFRQLGTEAVAITLLDGPTVSPTGPDLRRRLEWPLRVLLAAVVGVGLAFLAAYLDTSVRDVRDLERMGLTVLGTIPREGGIRR